VVPRKVAADQTAATERPRGNDQRGSDQDDVFQHILALQRRRVMRTGEQPGWQQKQRRDDPDELDRQKPDREAQPGAMGALSSHPASVSQSDGRQERGASRLRPRLRFS
jgi:hypothetical protein